MDNSHTIVPIQGFSDSLMQLAPILHPGVQIIRDNQILYVGLLHRGVEIKSSSPEQFIELSNFLTQCNGKKRLFEILQRNFQEHIYEIEALHQLITELRQEGLISFIQPLIKNRSESEIIFKERSQPEIDLEYFAGNYEDKRERPSEEFSHSLEIRRDKSILIFGANRLSNLLSTLLIASGIGAVKMVHRESGFAKIKRGENLEVIPNKKNEAIAASELIGLAFRGRDVGVNRTTLLDEIKSSCALGRSEMRESKAFPKVPDFIIATQPIQPDTSQRWMSEGIPHLQLSGLVESSVEIGPLVIPGRTPCLRCIALAESDINPYFRQLQLFASMEPSRELPTAAVALAAGITTLEIINYFRSSTSSLFGAIATYELTEMRSPVLQYWAPHRRCGCIR